MISKELVEGFRQLDTACISDAIDHLGITGGGLLGIKPVISGIKMCGQAFTVHYTACGEIKGTVGDFLDDVKPDQVVVIDNGGRLDCTVWGDIMSLYSSINKIAGTVIDGVCRDVPAIRELQYPIFTKGIYMRTGKDRVYVDCVNQPVTISAVQVVPGDLLIGDDSGVVVVPYAHAEEVYTAALNIEVKEQIIKDGVKKGEQLKVTRALTGYHTLQTKQTI